MVDSPLSTCDIFLSYRREDSEGSTGRLYDRLESKFAGRVFMDAGTILPGADFVDSIDQAVSSCRVLLVVIGREWLTATDSADKRRLDNPDDFVRREIITALGCAIPIIPVLVQGAAAPKSLPRELAKLERLHASELRHTHWASDVEKLVQRLEELLVPKALPARIDATVKKVVVAVHGIGDQTQFAAVQQVLSQFFHFHGEIATVPASEFRTDRKSLVIDKERYPELYGLAFAEVYWADLAHHSVSKKSDLKDIKPWVRTMISRARRGRRTARELTVADQLLVEQVLGEMMQSIGILERLWFLANKMGIVSFDAKKMVTDLVDGVQIIADFEDHGENLGQRFTRRLQEVHEEFPAAEIYIVAHGEGSVITLLGLIRALCSKDEAWIKSVHGLMTFGSPIDKYLVLRPELFPAFEAPISRPEKPIEWQNYYDYGDLMGFGLEAMRARYTTGKWAGVFNFSPLDDHGFGRYPLPGKAHTDYWQDAEVFGHFIRTVVYREEQVKPKPKSGSYERPPSSRWLAQMMSLEASYLGIVALLFCGVLFLYEAAHGYLEPNAAKQDLLSVFASVGRYTCLLAGVTVFVRIPRLTKVWTWRSFGLIFFLLSTIGYRIFPCIDWSDRLTPGDFQNCFETSLAIQSSGLGLIGAVIAVLAATYFISKLRPAWGMRALLVPASILGVLYLYMRVAGAPDERGDLWPVFLAALAFLYLWWLAARLFDLVFFWHRYIRFEARAALVPAKQL
jgi:hypothetical protein